MTKSERQSDQPGVWEPTRYQWLFRFVSSGVIFARFKIAGKQVRKNLKTSNLELAKAKLAELERSERTIEWSDGAGKCFLEKPSANSR